MAVGLVGVIGAALLGSRAVEAPSVALVSPAPIDGPSAPPIAQRQPRALVAAPEREHGTDGLMGSLPFGELLAENVEPASTRRGSIRPNGGLGWQTDPAAL